MPKAEPKNTTRKHRDVNGGDPLAAIAGELAEIERRRRYLERAEVRARLDEDANGCAAEELERQLDDKRRALRTMASHTQATDREGALLQALVALYDCPGELDDALPDGFFATPGGKAYNAARARLERLLYSIIYAAAPPSADLSLLREKMAPRGFHGIAAVERLGEPVPETAAG